MSCTWIDFYGRRGRLLLLKSTKRHHPASSHSAIGKNLFVLSSLLRGRCTASFETVHFSASPCPRSNPARVCLLSHATRGCTPGQSLQPSSFTLLYFFHRPLCLCRPTIQEYQKGISLSNVVCSCNLQSMNSKESRVREEAGSLPMDGQRVVNSNFFKGVEGQYPVVLSANAIHSLFHGCPFLFVRSGTFVSHSVSLY